MTVIEILTFTLAFIAGVALGATFFGGLVWTVSHGMRTRRPALLYATSFLVTGALKLSYAQFEELETFARFGARLDDQTRRILEHGQRIRECLKQPQFQSVSVQEQIVVLLALTEGLFDRVPLDKMIEAENAVRAATSELPTEIFHCLTGPDELKEDHRKAILATAKAVVMQFQQSL